MQSGEPVYPCFVCSIQAVHVLVSSDRLVLLCAPHLLHYLQSPQVHKVFPIAAWTVASRQVQFNEQEINVFLKVYDTVVRIGKVQDEEYILRVNGSNSSTPTRSAMVTRNGNLDCNYEYVKALFAHLLSEVKTVPMSDWVNAKQIQRSELLYGQYSPILLPPANEEMEVGDYLQKCDSMCKVLNGLMQMTRDVEFLKEVHTKTNSHRRKVYIMCETAENLINRLPDLRFYLKSIDSNERIQLRDVLRLHVLQSFQSVKEKCENEILGKDEVWTEPLLDFPRAALGIWNEMREIGFDSQNAEVSATAFHYQGECYLELKNYSEAEENFTAAQDTRGTGRGDVTREVTRTLLALGMLHLTMGNLESAERQFLLLLPGMEESLPVFERVEVYLAIGKLCLLLNRVDLSISKLREAELTLQRLHHKAESIDANVVFALGTSYQQGKRWPEAARCFQEARVRYSNIKNSVASARTCFYLGLVLELMGEQREACKCFLIALREVPNTDSIYAEIDEKCRNAGIQ